MKTFFEAFNELPKPPFVDKLSPLLDKLPPIYTIKQFAPNIPALVMGVLPQLAVGPGSSELTQKAKGKLIRTAVIIAESIFNEQVYLQPALKSQKEALQGTSLQVLIKELGEPITLIFSTTRVDILVAAEYESACLLTTDLKTLMRLRDKNQLTALIKEEAILVEGDIEVLQKLNQLIEKIEPGIGAILSPVVGDLAAGVIESVLKQLFQFILSGMNQTKVWLTEAVTEGLQIVPHPNAKEYAKSK